MTGRIVEEYEFSAAFVNGTTGEQRVESPVALASAMTLCVGIIQILMALFRWEIVKIKNLKR
jgi:predicted transporter